MKISDFCCIPSVISSNCCASVEYGCNTLKNIFSRCCFCSLEADKAESLGDRVELPVADEGCFCSRVIKYIASFIFCGGAEDPAEISGDSQSPEVLGEERDSGRREVTDEVQGVNTLANPRSRFSNRVNLNSFLGVLNRNQKEIPYGDTAGALRAKGMGNGELSLINDLIDQRVVVEDVESDLED